MPAFRSTRPRFLAHCTATHSIAAGFQVIPWDVIDEDDGAGYSAGQYTCDRDGLWLMGAHLSRNSIAAATTPQARVNKNGVSVGTARGAALAAGQGFSSTWSFQALQGDVIALQIFFSSTVAVTLNDDARWWLHRIGPKSWNF